MPIGRGPLSQQKSASTPFRNVTSPASTVFVSSLANFLPPSDNSPAFEESDSFEGLWLMEALQKKIPKIDFRPRRTQRYRFLVVALLLLGGVIWWGWRWISPYDRAHFVEKQLDSATAEQLNDLLYTLPGLEAPGYRVLFSALGHPQPEVRRAARTNVSELLDRWQRDPAQQPKILAALTIMLAERASTFPEAERQESQDVFRRWVNLATSEKISAALAQREFHARRQLLEWIVEPRLAQPPRLRGHERAERTAKIQALLVNATTGIGNGSEQSAASQVQLAAATIPKNETTFQVLAVSNDMTDTAPKMFPQNEASPSTTGGSTNRAMHLPNGPNSESHPSTPLSIANENRGKVRRASAETMSSSEFLGNQAPSRYRQAAPEARRQMLAEFQAEGCAAGDLELLELYAVAPPAALGEVLNALPQRTDVEGQLWLRQFATHPDSAVRRAAWSWLVTSPDRATRQWLAELANAEQDADLRQWYQAMTKQRKSR